MEKQKTADVVKYEDDDVLMNWKSEAMIFGEKSRDFYSTVLVFGLLIGVILFFIEGPMPVLLTASVVFFIFVSGKNNLGEIEHTITTKGIKSGDSFYEWTSIKSYWVENRHGRDVFRLLLTSLWPGQISLVIPKVDEEKMRIRLKAILDEHTKMVVPEETGTDRFLKWISSKLPLE